MAWTVSYTGIVTYFETAVMAVARMSAAKSGAGFTFVPGFRCAHPGYNTTTLPRSCQRAVDHRHRIGQAVDRDERPEARAFFLTEQHLVEHVEPVERDARPAILAFLHRIQERLAAADLVDHVLDL